jgi:hypothetical protein
LQWGVPHCFRSDRFDWCLGRPRSAQLFGERGRGREREGEREREREEEDDESWAALDFFYFLSGVFLFFYFVLEREKNKPLDLWTGYSYPLSRNTSLPELRR